MSFEKFWKKAMAPNKEPMIVNIFRISSIGKCFIAPYVSGLAAVPEFVAVSAGTLAQ
jgi:hypothetical protein